MSDYSVFISAGEPSGDLHAANLIRALRSKITPSDKLRVRAMGGEKLTAANAEIIVDCAELAVIGIIEVLKNWSQIQAALKTLKQNLENDPPDLLILVDYVEFNLKLAAHAKSLGIKVLFYVSPQVWAWRSHRVKKIGQAIDAMAVIFPFETQIYEDNHIPVRYVGHPLADEVHPNMSKTEAKKAFGVDVDQLLVALLPGSRQSEVNRILPIMLKAAEQVKRALPNVQFIAPIAPSLPESLIDALLEDSSIELIRVSGQSYDVLNCANSAMVASGTATLETALLEIPMSIVYKVNALSYQIFKRLIEVEHIGLANIVAGKRIVPEFIQHEAQPELIAAEVVRQINHPNHRDQIIRDLKEVKLRLGTGGGSANVAQMALDMMQGKEI